MLPKCFSGHADHNSGEYPLDGKLDWRWPSCMFADTSSPTLVRFSHTDWLFSAIISSQRPTSSDTTGPNACEVSAGKADSVEHLACIVGETSTAVCGCTNGASLPLGTSSACDKSLQSDVTNETQRTTATSAHEHGTVWRHNVGCKSVTEQCETNKIVLWDRV